MPLIPWLRGDRAAVLSALALAMGAREPLPEALAALAAEDPLLRPWAARLGPALRAGAALPALLRRTRALDRDEAAELAASGDPARTLGRLAAGSGLPPRGYLFVRWYPAWMATWLLAILILAKWTIYPYFIQMYLEIGVRMPGITMSILSIMDNAWRILGLIWAATLFLERIPGLRHGLLTWSPEVHRTAAWWRLVRWTRLGVLDRQGSWWHRDTAQRSWSTWWLLSCWRLPTAWRRHLVELPIRDRLRELGIPHRAADGVPDWERSEAEALERFRLAVAGSWILGTWSTQFVLIVTLMVLSAFLPLFMVD